MCCCNILSVVGKYLKIAVVVTVFLFIAAIVLIIVGGVFIKQGDGLEKFKAAVKAFDDTPIQAWTGTINGSQATVKRMSLNVEGVDGATSAFTEANVPLPGDSGKRSSSTSSAVFSVNITNIQIFTRRINLQKITNTTYTCTKKDCIYKKGRCTCETMMKDFEKVCKINGGNPKDANSRCIPGDLCSRCYYTGYLSIAHLVVSEGQPGKYQENLGISSAKYDFTNEAHDYDKQEQPEVNVRVYSDKDPFIAQQRLTKGTGHFDTSRRTGGIVMVVIGVLLLLLAIGLCGLLIGFCVRRKQYPTIINSGQPTPSNQAATDAPGYVAPNGYAQTLPPPQWYPYGQLQQSQQPQDYVYPQPPVAPQGYGYGQPLSVPQGYVYGQPQQYFYGQPLATQSAFAYEEAPPQYTYGESDSQPNCKGDKEVNPAKK